MTQDQRDDSRPALTFLAAFAVVAGLLAWAQLVLLPRMRSVEAAFAEQGRRLEAIEESLALLHFTREPDKDSLHAILDYIEYWAGKLAESGQDLVLYPKLEERLALGTKALRAYGPDAFQALQRRFVAALSEGSAKNGLKAKLLELAKDVDRGQAEELAVEVLTNPSMPSFLRNAAARELLVLDRTKAGDLLREILLYESHKGLRKPDAPYLRQDFHRLPAGMAAQSYMGYWNNVMYYLQSDNPQKEDTLLALLLQPYHNVSTYGAILNGLQQLKSRRAVPYLKQLFDDPVGDLGKPSMRMKMKPRSSSTWRPGGVRLACRISLRPREGGRERQAAPRPPRRGLLLSPSRAP
ncbi:MAG: hypothetical protein R3F30_11930 [Planctomycetota bacterium]